MAANGNLQIRACAESIRLRVSTTASGSYFFNGGWEIEFMGSSRVMPDATLLPNGIVILLNGAQNGLAGDSASGGGSRADFPNFSAEMYDPDAPAGQRWSTLARSQVARLYHSVAVLTRNGTILVSGCDRCWKYQSTLPFVASPAKADYRNEIFYPPFWYDANKPVIVDWPSSARYNDVITIQYAGEDNVTPQVGAEPWPGGPRGSGAESRGAGERPAGVSRSRSPSRRGCWCDGKKKEAHAPPHLARRSPPPSSSPPAPPRTRSTATSELSSWS